jgi:hypothetical protein
MRSPTAGKPTKNKLFVYFSFIEFLRNKNYNLLTRLLLHGEEKMVENVSFEQLPGEPIVVVSLGKDYDFITGAEEGTQAALDVLDRQTQPVFWIVDFHIAPDQEHSLNFEQLLVSSNSVTELWSDPRIRQVLVVTSDEIVRLAAQGMGTEAFGNLSIALFGSLNEAFAYARARI